MRARARFGILLLVEASAVIAAHQVGADILGEIDWARPLAWLDRASPEDAIAAVGALIALGLAYWVAATTLLYLATRVMPAGRSMTRLTGLTLPVIRRTIDRALAATVAVAVLAGPMSPAMAGPPESPPPAIFEIASDGIPVPHLTPTSAGAAGEPAGEPDDATVQPIAPANPAVPVRGPAPVVGAVPTPSPILANRRTVVSGDNLWRIAADVVTATDSKVPVAHYWRRLIAENRATLRSGDPNLIYPGEILLLPPVSP